MTADFIVIGAGSAGCVVASELAAKEAGSVMIVEAGPSDSHPLVKMPFGLVWLMGSRRDWCFESVPQTGLAGRQIDIPRGRMLGGSSSINSMVWFRGRQDDFDGWSVPGWAWKDVEPHFEAIESSMQPNRLKGAHPLVEGLQNIFGDEANQAPTPERESAGVFRYNIHDGKRRSAADAFLRSGSAKNNLSITTGCVVDRIVFNGDKATGVVLDDGSEIQANKGIVLSAGSIGSPSILLRSGIGPVDQLNEQGIDLKIASEEVGENLHDHPSVGLHFWGEGYGITAAQMPAWIAAPFAYLFNRSGRLASPTVEGGAFFNARAENEQPDIQSHFIPFKQGWQGKRFTAGSGYFADVCLCRPKSRGSLRLSHRSANAQPVIDLGLLQDERDLDTLVAGLERLRRLIERIDLKSKPAMEAYPGKKLSSEIDLQNYIRQHCATAYHPVGTLRMGEDNAPVTPRLAVRGVDQLWVADASVMPAVTSANTNAPSMMIGHRASQLIMEDAA